MITDPVATFAKLDGLELFNMTREETIFMALCSVFQSNGKPQLFKCAGIAEGCEGLLKKRDGVMRR